MPDEAAHPAGQPPGPVASSAYRTGRDFERAIQRAAAGLRRKGLFPREGAWLVVWGGIVALFALARAAVPLGSWRFGELPGWREVVPAAVVVGLWLIWYLFRAHLLGADIVERRLCFGCGRSLLDVAVGDAGEGACPGCGRPFNLGMYRPPTVCIAALSQARERMLRRCPPAASTPGPIVRESWPPGTGEGSGLAPMSPREFARRVRRAAGREIVREPGVIAGLALVGALIVAMVVAATVYGDDGLVWAGAALLVGVVGVAIHVSARQVVAEDIIAAAYLRRHREPGDADEEQERPVLRRAPSDDPFRTMLAAVWNPSLAMPPHPPARDAGSRGLSPGSILVARLRRVVLAVRRRLRRA